MEERFLYQEKKVQEFREADADGRIGMYGYLSYFQDAAASYMHRFDWGNDKVHEKYGVAWVYTKYRMQLFEKAIYDAPLDIECWIEATKHSFTIYHAIEIRKRGILMARGRLESCLVDLQSGRIARLERIGYDPVLAMERMNVTPPFTKIAYQTDGAKEVYKHKVRYSDLDNNRHMNNLRYVPLLIDAYDLDFHDHHRLVDMEINYREQCFYDEELTVCRQDEDALSGRVLVMKENGKAAVCARMKFESIKEDK